MSLQFEQTYHRIRRELTVAIATLMGVILIGTCGYRWIEGWTWLNSAYMTFITLSTVGFTEVEPLSPQGRGFTIALIIMGITSFGYIANRFTELLIRGYVQQEIRLRQQKRLMESLSNHYIVCGFGRMGQQVALEFASENIAFVIVDFQPDSVEAAEKMGYVVIQGDATLDETLSKAKIERATCLVAALSSDAENLYTVLSAKTLNPTIRAIARASTEEAVKKLQRGGADAVISPYISGGRRMAAAALRPQIMDFMDAILTGANRSFYMEEFRIDPASCPCVGQTLEVARLGADSGALVLAIRRMDGTFLTGPQGDTPLEPMDILICMGTAEQLRRLNQILSPLNENHLRTPRHSP